MDEATTEQTTVVDRAALEQELATAREWRQQFTQAAWQLGDARSMCSSYDDFLRSIDIAPRPRQYNVTMVRGIERPRPDVVAQHATVSVRATSQDEAYRLAAEQAAAGGLDWDTASDGDTSYYLPETARQLDATVVIAARRYGTDPDDDTDDDDND